MASTSAADGANAVEAAVRHNACNPFLSLSGELRNQIYSYLFPPNVKWDLQFPNHFLHKAASGRPLKFVCRQLHCETSTMEISNAIFHCSAFWPFTPMLDRFSSAQRESITHISIALSLWSHYETSSLFDYIRTNHCVFAEILPGVRRFYIRDFLPGGSSSVLASVTPSYWAAVKRNLRLLDRWCYADGNNERRVVYALKLDFSNDLVEELKELGLMIEFEVTTFSGERLL